MTPLVKIAQQGRVLVATLDNPCHALLTDAMVDELSALIDRADNDPGVGAVVLTDAHPQRVTPHDDVRQSLQMSQFSPSQNTGMAARSAHLMASLESAPGAGQARKANPTGGPVDVPRFHELMNRMGRSGAVFLAAIHGETAGSGLELAMACDMRFLSTQGRVVQPEMLLGFPPGGGGTQRLPRLIGLARTLEWVLSGRAIEPEEALRIGLVNRVIAHEQLLPQALTVATVLARRGKDVAAAIKQAALDGHAAPPTCSVPDGAPIQPLVQRQLGL
jgi:enoyl-CoA hydratase